MLAVTADQQSGRRGKTVCGRQVSRHQSRDVLHSGKPACIHEGELFTQAESLTLFGAIASMPVVEVDAVGYHEDARRVDAQFVHEIGLDALVDDGDGVRQAPVRLEPQASRAAFLESG